MPTNRGAFTDTGSVDSGSINVSKCTLPTMSSEYSLKPARRVDRCGDWCKQPGRFTLLIIFVLMVLITAICVLVVFLQIGGAIDMGPNSAGDTSGQSKTSQDGRSLTRNGFYGETKDGVSVEGYTLKNKNSIEVIVITYGGTITSIKVPDKDGQFDDVTLGFDDLAGYESSENPYFGCIVGRYANRIANGRFVIDGATYNTPTNNGQNTLHGGVNGFNKKVWKPRIDDTKLVLAYTSVDGEEGFPGRLSTLVTYELTNENELIITFEATTNLPTPVSLTNHAYFNLAVKGNQVPSIYNHVVTLNADRYTPSSSNLIPTGVKAAVDGTDFDLRSGVTLRTRINDIPGGGYDHNFCVNGPTGRKLASRVESPSTGRVLEVFTNQPGVQFYTGNFLGGFQGRGGANYTRHTGFCLEPQNYPDAPNKQPEFPDPILRPGSTYHHQMIYKFSTK